MTQELRSCPFCGGEAIARDYDTDTDAWSVSCNSTDRTCIATVFSFNSPDEAAAAWNRRADDADRARLVAQVSELQARVTELESAIVIDRGVFNRLCTLQAIMEHPVATPSAEEFDEYTGLLELVFHTHEKETADNE